MNDTDLFPCWDKVSVLDFLLGGSHLAFLGKNCWFDLAISSPVLFSPRPYKWHGHPPSELARSPGPHPDSHFLLSISLHQLPSSPLYSVTSASGIPVFLSLSTPATLDRPPLLLSWINTTVSWLCTLHSYPLEVRKALKVCLKQTPGHSTYLSQSYALVSCHSWEEILISNLTYNTWNDQALALTSGSFSPAPWHSAGFISMDCLSPFTLL